MNTSLAKVLIPLRYATLAAALALVSCATGSKFTPAEAVPEGKALIYVYRMNCIGGIASIHRIYANGGPVASFANASYYPFITSPGTIVFSSKSRTVNGLIDAINSKDHLLTLEAQSNETYYLEFHIGDTWGPKLFLVNTEIGSKRIRNCRLAETFTEKK